MFHQDITGYFKCAQEGHFTKECQKNKLGNGTSRGTNCLYAINGRQEKEDFPHVLTGMIQVFDFTVFALLEPRESLSFINLYVAINCDIIPEQLSEPFCNIHEK